MRGGGHSNYVADPKKREEFKREIAERNEINPAALIGYFPAEWIHATDTYHRVIGATALSQIISEPFPPPTHHNDQELQQMASNNISIYDDDIENQMYTDEVLLSLMKERERYTGSEEYSRLVRTRRTVLAYIAFAAMEDHSAA